MSFALTTGGAANQLVVSRTGSGTGVITSSPAGISCGTTCSAYFASTAVVTLLASPDAGSIFSGWGGTCSGNGASGSGTWTATGKH